METDPAVLVLMSGGCLWLALLVFVMWDHPASWQRVIRFADRHRLALTAGNGSQVVAYLRIVRRWRLACVTFAVCLSVGVGVLHQQLTFNFMAILAGMFGGIMLAELRMVRIVGVRRTASLAPRRLRDYLHPLGRWTFALSVGLSAVLTLVVIAVGTDPLDVWLSLAIGPAVAVVGWLSMRRVVRRAQPQAEPDRLAADNAIRRQSLQMLAASGAALALYGVLSQLEQLFVHNGAAGLRWVLIPVGLLGVPWFAWRVAVRPAQAVTT